MFSDFPVAINILTYVGKIIMFAHSIVKYGKYFTVNWCELSHTSGALGVDTSVDAKRIV